jgi:queuine tRNA-ribosyltransferase
MTDRSEVDETGGAETLSGAAGEGGPWMSPGPAPFTFRLDAVDEETGARAGVIETPRGRVETPVFMPVGTQATVKTLTPQDLAAMGAGIVLANTYHLYLRPGPALIRGMGGLHRFMSWPGLLLTDSGGFQVFSLADLNQVTEEGVRFQSHLDGSRHLLTPELATEVQLDLGSDIVMAFDQCTTYPVDRGEAAAAVERTTRWARRSVDRWRSADPRDTAGRALFGIVQGSTFEDLRRVSRDALLDLDLPGYAIGGLAVGEPKPVMMDLTAYTAALLPPERPRYLMGVGFPDDIVEAVSRGVDMFDCVMPTRNARNGTVFTRDGKLVVKNRPYAEDPRPLDEECACPTCRTHSRGYIRHLFQAGEMLGPRLTTLHSLWFYQDVMREMRRAIVEGRFGAWRKAFLTRFRHGRP